MPAATNPTSTPSLLDSRTPRLYLIDGHWHLYQAFYALGAGLTSPTGMPTGAVFGFTNMLLALIKEARPENLAILFDMGRTTFRSELFADYKANRPAMPDDLRAQIPHVHEILAAMRIPFYQVEGYEADDLMGTITRAAVEAGMDVYLVTGDKDACQLVGDGVYCYDSRKKLILGPDQVAQRLGVRPDQVVDFLSLVGDASDNVPGVPGIGPKTAGRLLGEFGDLETLLGNLERVKGARLKESLAASSDRIRLATRLVTIDTEVPFEFDLEECRLGHPDRQRLMAAYRELGFHRFLEEIPPPPVEEGGQTNYRAVTSAAAVRELAAELARAPRGFALEVVGTDPDPMRAELAGLTLAVAGGRAWYVPLVGDGALDLDVVLAALRPLLEDAEYEKWGHGLQRGCVLLGRHGVTLLPPGRESPPAFDVALAAHVLNPDRKEAALEELATIHLSSRPAGFGEARRSARGPEIWELPAEEAARISCPAVDVVVRLVEVLEAKLRKWELHDLFRELETPLIPVLARMQVRGIAVDRPALEALGAQLDHSIDDLERRIHEAAGVPFNVDSPQQLGEILFERLGLPAARKKKTGWSTDATVLEKLADRHPICNLVLEYRSLVKLRGTYATPLLERIDPASGRIHTTYSQIGAVTGRLASRQPNLQNIPVRTETGRRIRDAFVAPAGSLLLVADYSQIELRMLAHLSDAERLKAVFEAGEDIHADVARQVFGAADPETRRRAKAVNFGIIYGQTPFGLSEEIGVSRADATDFIRAYFERFPGVRAFIDSVIEGARRDAFVTTILGRRRYLPEINSRNPTRRAFAERTAINTVVQGSAADLIKVAMINLDTCIRLGDLPARLLLSVHDELVFEVGEQDLEKAREVVVAEMTEAMDLGVPLAVKVGWGRTWTAVNS